MFSGIPSLVSNSVIRGLGTDGKAFATSSSVMKDSPGRRFANKLQACADVVFPFCPPYCSGENTVSHGVCILVNIILVSNRHMVVDTDMGRYLDNSRESFFL